MRLLTPVVLALLSVVALAEDPKPAPAPVPRSLRVGSSAPALSITKWIQGDPVTSLVKDKVYVLEFWATWCGPCIRVMPHLTELQKKYADRGLVVIGITLPDARGNTLEAVERFVSARSADVGYRIAWDADRATGSAYMGASGRSSIPTSFLVDGAGRVVYIGHPSGLDELLPLVLDKKHDVEALAKSYERTAMAAARTKQLMGDLNAARLRKDWTKALSVADALVALDSEGDRRSGAMAKFQVLAQSVRDPAKAIEFAKSYFEGPGKGDWVVASIFATMIVDPSMGFDKDHLDYARELALAAISGSKSENASTYISLARVEQARGDAKAALEAAERAAKLEPSFTSQLEPFRKAAAEAAR